MKTIKFTVNGRRASVDTEPDRPLLDVLREDLHLTGTKFGCGQGDCGACSVLLDGKRVFSCSTPISETANKSVTTIEGLAKGDVLHPVQAAFLEQGAFQCGYCTAGMIVAAVSLLSEVSKPTDEQIVSGMNNNLCRCCSHPKIMSAIKQAAGIEVSSAEGRG